jgi:hypothetical protein
MRVALVLIICLLCPALAIARVDMTIQPAVGPTGGKVFDQFSQNTHQALVQKTSSIGDAERQPAAYRQVSRVFQGQLIITSFPCWYGVNQPPAPFSNERGNRLYFPLRILGNGRKIRLANLTCKIDSGDAMEVMNYEGGYSASAYNKHRVGIDYGPDGKRDTSDDVIYDNNQPGGVAVDEIIYTGIGIGVQSVDSKGAVTKRDKEMEHLMNSLLGTQQSYDLKINYSLLDDDDTTTIATASTTVRVYPQPAHIQIGPVPESPWPLFVGAGAGMALILLVAGTRQMIRRHRHRVLSMTPLPDEG